MKNKKEQGRQRFGEARGVVCAAVLAGVFFLPFCAAAETAAPITSYPPDPVFKPLNPEAPEPMDAVRILAEEGDVRAQFILGDLYAKGKGGLPKDPALARKWFETSARNGYVPGFVRLAAMDKKAKKYARAYQWYTLAAQEGQGEWRDYARKARDALAKDYKLNDETLTKARHDARQWRDKAEDTRRIKAAREKAQGEKTSAKKDAAKKDTGKKPPVKKEPPKKDAAKKEPAKNSKKERAPHVQQD